MRNKEVNHTSQGVLNPSRTPVESQNGGKENARFPTSRETSSLC